MLSHSFYFDGTFALWYVCNEAVIPQKQYSSSNTAATVHITQIMQSEFGPVCKNTNRPLGGKKLSTDFLIKCCALTCITKHI